MGNDDFNKELLDLFDLRMHMWTMRAAGWNMHHFLPLWVHNWITSLILWQKKSVSKPYAL